MPTVKKLYYDKLRTAEEAIQLVQNGDFIVVAAGVGEPPAILMALSEHRGEYHDVKVCQVIPHLVAEYFDADTVDHIRHVAYFLSSPSRLGAQQGWVDYFPNSLSELPKMIREGCLTSDTVISLASPIDKQGYFSISLGTSYTMAAIEKARNVILEVNPNVPYAYGNNLVHISEVSAIVEDDRPVRTVALPRVTAVHEAIGQYVAELIEDGSTIQLGYGGIPDAVVNQLVHKHDLGIHTEVFGDGLLSLIEKGAVTNRKKNYLPNKSIASFVGGSTRLYEYLDHNPELETHPLDFTNDPCLAGQNDNLMSINASLQIDFLGQCCSESIGSIPYSGTGGQSDFVRAANRSKGGKAFIVIPSTAKNGTISRITPVLQPGAAVSTSKNDVNYIVTEYGIAQLRGKSAKQRTRELISIAHPDFRGELTEAAKKMKLW